MNSATLLEDVGIDPVKAVEYMGYLDLTVDDLSIPQRYAKFESVIEYLKEFPEDTRKFLIKKATYNKVADKLNCMHEYMGLLKEKKIYEDEIEKIKKQKSVLGNTGMDNLKEVYELSQHETEISRKLQLTSEEIEIYHR